MEILLVFGGALLIAVALSELARRSVVSTAVVFLVIGYVANEVGFTGAETSTATVVAFTEVALFTVLFTDAMFVSVGDLTSSWRLPSRALLVGMPLAWALTAGLALLLTTVPVLEALLLAAVLAPTDPVLASAIVGRQTVPYRLRHLLQVESGLNDGIMLPVVLALLAVLGGTQVAAGRLAIDLGLGIVVGVAVPLLIIAVLRIPPLRPAERYQPFVGVTIALVVFASAQILHGNLFLAAFAAGVTVATAAPKVRESFNRLGEPIAELVKLGALFLFGSLISTQSFGDLGPGDALFAILVLVAARPIAMLLVLAGSPLRSRERVAAAWFGPKGFASVVYGLHVLQSGIEGASHLFHIAALAIGFSMILHSSTDIVVARWFREEEPSANRVGS